MLNNQLKFSLWLIFFLAINSLLAQQLKDCKIELSEDKLTLSNSKIIRTYAWNKGSLISTSLVNRGDKQTWELSNEEPDFRIPGMGEAEGDELSVKIIEATDRTLAHLQGVVITRYRNFELKRVFRLYPDCPAIAIDIYLKGKAPNEWYKTETSVNALKNYEMHGKDMVSTKDIPVMDRLGLPGRHWALEAVDFYDGTDNQNTLVDNRKILAYRFYNSLKGNLLFADDRQSGKGIFILKEAPPSNVQLAYPGFDFFCKIGDIQTVGLGLQPQDVGLNVEDWVRAYGSVTGVTDGSEFGKISALREYYMNSRPHVPERDDMILMNTWGDRSRATKISEQFCLDELEAGHRLGVTHFQIDYGWSQGRSPFTGEYYKINESRFPNGLNPLVEKANSLGMTMGIYGNPGSDNYPYLHWQQFSNAFVNVYEQTGISLIKYDLFRLADKLSDINARRIMDDILSRTNNDAFFNIDITFQDRVGYFYWNEYGNYFVENRYTDWLNYYPHWTLRNLWMLSKYVPSYMLQVEFLNKWRNADKYPEDDPFKPSLIPFDYIFAITMAGQPLAWFEATGLPEEAFKIAPLVKTYKEHQTKIHGGMVFPIGEEPSGSSWTGFQSMDSDQGYLLVYREQNENSSEFLKTWFPAGTKIRCQLVAGHGKGFNATINDAGELKFSLPKENTFALYRYEIL